MNFKQSSINLRRISHCLFAVISTTTLLACTPDITPVDYTKLPEYGSETVSLFVTRCGECHAAPNPSVHTKSLWPVTVYRMKSHMTSKKSLPLNAQQEKQIVDYLVKYASN